MTESQPRTFWVDENLPPALAAWFSSQPPLRGVHFLELGYEETPDRDIFSQGRKASSTIVSKDGDFASLVTDLGAPPQVVWVRTGNVRTAALLDLFSSQLTPLLQYLDAGIPLVALGA